MITVYSYTPCSSIVPYDYHGRLGAMNIQEKLSAVGIESTVQEEKQRLENPIGSGPGGRVRVGDEMLPSIYHIQVDKKYEKKAKSILSHKIDTFVRDRIGKLLMA